MAHVGQEIEGFGGHRLRIVTLEPDLLAMEATYTGEGDMPPPHLHPKQDERFTVLEGALRTVIDGEPRRYEAGDVFEVPAGTSHQMGGDGPARFRWEVRPALRTAEFFETLYGGKADENFLEEFSEEFRLA